MRSTDESARRTPQRPRRAQGDLRLALRRSGAVLPWRCSPLEAPALTADEILHAARAVASRPGALLISDEAPLRRDDIWQLLAELAALRPAHFGMCSTGQGIGPAVAQRLRAHGVQRLHIPFHCARQDAHDWLVGQVGALKAAHRAIRACVDAQLPVTAEIVLTRPTAPHLAETIEVLARVGVRAVCVRRLTANDADGTTFVPLSARMSLLEKPLEDAAAVALQRRVRIRLRDLPLCAAPRLRRLFSAADSEAWVQPDGSVRLRSDGGVGCASCPGSPHCAGVPPDYATRFGWEEFVDPMSAAVRVEEDVQDQTIARRSAPMVFAWRGPRRLRCEACADAPDERAKASPHESTRVVRARLVEAARYRPSVLRLVGADLLAHPQAALLIYDAVRLFPRVEVAGEASAVVDWSDLDLRRLKDLHRVDVALYGPDAATHDAHCGIPGAFAAMLRGVERLRTDSTIAVGAYAILHDARWFPAFAAAWDRGDLPGEPRFRLSAKGSALEELFHCARELPAGAAQSALLAVLPHCADEAEGLPISADGRAAGAASTSAPQQRIQAGRSVPYHPRGSDPIGAFAACQEGAEPCAVRGCPGIAVGWRSTARSKQWTVNI